MEGLIRLINHATTSSVRNVIRWADIFLLNPRGWELERALVPATHQLPLPISLIPAEADEDACPNKWEGFLWAAPKKRTSAMKRLRRKFGHSDWGSPLLKPKTNLRICDNCGHHYEAKHLCRNCYDKVKAETELIRSNIASKFGHGAEDQSVVVLYESEKENMSIEAKKRFQANMIVEIPKPRPTWFSHNLLQRSTAGIDTETKAIEPQDAKPIIVSSKTESP